MTRRASLAFRCSLAMIALSAAALSAESAGGLHWTAPAGWTNEGARPMRAATYRIAPAAGDKDGGECGVYFFGAGQGGSVDANLERWKGQFKGPDGKVPPAKIAKRTINGLAVTTIDTSGEYSGMGGPMSPGGGRRRLSAPRCDRRRAQRQHLRQVHWAIEDCRREPAEIRTAPRIVPTGQVTTNRFQGLRQSR